MTKLSIIIPYKDVEAYISKCLDSVTAQTLTDIEIICIDDSSQDDSRAIVQKYADNDKRIIMLSTGSSDSGQSYARNLGLEIATGEYIGFVDSDDWVEPDMFEKMYNKAKSDDTDITMCGTTLYNDKTQEFYNDDYYSLKPLKKFGDRVFSPQDSKDEILDINVVLWNKIYKREFLVQTKAKFQSGYIYEDMPFFFETYLKAKKINIIWETLYYYRQNRIHSTMQNSDKKVYDRIEMSKKTYEILKQSIFFEEKQDEIHRWIIDDIIHRYTLLESKYYEEYYKLMREFFISLNLNKKQKEALKIGYYCDEFEMILERDYYGFWNFLIEKYKTSNKRIKEAEHKCNLDIKAIKEYLEQYKKQAEEDKEETITWWEKHLEKQKKQAEEDKEETIKNWENCLEQQKKQAEEDKKETIKNWENCLEQQKKQAETDKAETIKWWENYLEQQKKQAENDKAETIKWWEKHSQEEKIKEVNRKLDEQFKYLEAKKQTEMDNLYSEFVQKMETQKNELENWQKELLKEQQEKLKSDYELNNEKEKQHYIDVIEEQKNKYNEFEQQYKEMLSSAKECYESEINLLKTKIEYSKSKQDTELESQIAKTKKEIIEYYNVKNFNDIQEIKNYYENKIKDMTEWYEKEILRRQNETAAWHENNLKEKIEELTKKYESTISQLNTNFNEEIEVLSTQLLEQKKYYEQQLNPFYEIIELKNKIFSKNNKKTKSKEEINIITTQVPEKDKRPKVSVILPIYNVGKYLRQSLDSLINQSLKEIEIICVDDGSTDDSYDILEEYKNKDSRIKVIHKENKGTGAARNDGLKLATGECIGFVDPDDWVKPIMYERLYNLLKEKNLDIAMCMPDGYDEKNGINRPFPYFVDDNFKNIIDDRIFNWRDLSPFQYPMCVWNKLYTKELFDKNQIWFTEGLDFEDHSVIFGTLLTAERMFFIREKLYVYRFNRVGSVLSDNNRRLIDHIEIFNIVEDLMKRTNTYSALRKDFLFYKIHNILYYYSMIKDEFKQEYYENMVKSIRDTNLSTDEINMLSEKYPEIKSYV